LLDLTGVRLRTALMEADDIWHVSFDLPHTGEQHEIVLQISESERPYAVSCTSPAVKPVPRYRLIEHRSTINS
jgi:hypothetical protein